MKNKPNSIINKVLTYVITGIVCGLLCGGACLFFAWLSSLCDTAFRGNSWLLYLLPVTGLAVVLLYDFFRKGEDLTTDALFRYSYGQSGKTEYETCNYVSPWLTPLIMFSTCFAYLTGGSLGRVGSALQAGGCLGVQLHRLYDKLLFPDCYKHFGYQATEFNRNLFLACGMGAGFTAMLNAPVAGAIFGVEVLVLSGAELLIVFPALISTFITWYMAHFFHISYVNLHIILDFSFGIKPGSSLSDNMLWKILLVAFAATLLGRIYAYGRTGVTKMFALISNKIARVLVGTGLVIIITLLLGETWYNGIGFVYIHEILNGNGDQFAFIWKLLLTTITLGCGIRGGDISPSIFVGATGGFTLGCLIGLDPGIAAAVGIVGTLASVTKCPVAIFVLGLEMLCCNLDSAICFIIAVLIAHFLSGTYGIYHQQHSENQIFKPNIR